MSSVDQHEERMELFYASLPNAWEAWLECLEEEEAEDDEDDS